MPQFQPVFVYLHSNRETDISVCVVVVVVFFWAKKNITTGGSAAGSSSSPRRSQHKCRSQTASPRVDSKKILRHLVTPPVGHRASSFDELLHLHTQTPKCSVERES
ncbi:hypothetical protein SK128_010112 [Halocaridina rubra]|uniref:Uncharacterized protein n=1 Tax=Halocaridina rubra TaxID=373956 RepID=A0AAN9A2D7_HALRR